MGRGPPGQALNLALEKVAVSRGGSLIGELDVVVVDAGTGVPDLT
jgi:hypothetical protein